MKFKKKTLKNGVRLITVPMPNSLTTTVLVLTETGSKYESKRINGVSHFLEHLCFKGTEKRPTSKAISEELDGLGASYNAFTGYEYTGYYAKAETRHFKKVLDVVSDIYLNGTFPKEEIEKERGVIIGEIEMYEDSPQRDVWDLFTDLLYGNQPAGWPIAGTRKTIRNMTRKDIVDYKRRNYVASSTVVIIAGNCDENEVAKEVSVMFAKIPNSKKASKKKTSDTQKKPSILIKHKKTSQTHVIVGFRAYRANHKDGAALSVLAGVLGGGMSSRLFHRIRDQLGAGYYISAEAEFLTDHGFFAVSTGIDNKRVAEILHAIIDEIKIIKNNPVSEVELQKVKNYLIGNLFSGLETSHARAQFYGLTEVLEKKLKTPQERAVLIQKVSANDIRRVANNILKTKKGNIALIGPYAKKDGKKLLSLLAV
ncbi:MAG: insulinase family protein [Parcubacteria group bacterium]|nr:insulinase family protein [Parcubacteria group bacterium]